MIATEAVLKRFKTYLIAAIPSPNLLAVYDDWPSPSEALKMPGITILTGDPTFTQKMNYVVSKDASPPIGDPPEDPPLKTNLRKCNGSYDFVLKCHLWAVHKAGRQKLYDLFQAAMNPDFTVSGLRLQMPDYFNEWATFDIQKVIYLDNEESVQRSERRIIVDVAVNCRSIVQTSDYLMKEIENNLETPGSIPNTSNPGSTTIA